MGALAGAGIMRHFEPAKLPAPHHVNGSTRPSYYLKSLGILALYLVFRDGARYDAHRSCDEHSAS